MSYARFATMIVVSIVVMYGLMYLNTWGPSITCSSARHDCGWPC